MKPVQHKKLEYWCEVVCVRDENILISSLNNPSVTVLLGSETFTVMTLPTDSDTTEEFLSDNDSEGHRYRSDLNRSGRYRF